jgi:hypothetical protein
MHKRFQELSALAATGQISREERTELDRHTRECTACREFLRDLSLMKTHVAAVVAAKRARTSEPPQGIRERFLRRAAGSGVTINAGPVLATAEPAVAADGSDAAPPAATVRRLVGDGSRAVHYALPVAACLLCGLAGYYLALRHPAEIPEPVLALRSLEVPLRIPAPLMVQMPQPPDNRLAQRVGLLEREGAEADRRIESLTAVLGKAQAESDALAQQLAAASQRAAAAAGFEQEFRSAIQRLQESDDRVRQLTSDLNTERSLRHRLELAQLPLPAPWPADKRSGLAEASDHVDVSARSAHNDFAELISARNLHIVDVYDSAGNGKRQRPFGRVFYVEGRSLVFYAYDLDGGPRANAKVAFHVWGERASVKSTTYNLGILRVDDVGESRWVLTFDDPKVLNRCDAVYVTAEAGNDVKREPRGRKILYAFLGSANHP